jgi:predicted RecA/RadA family phage recombinase
VKNYRGTGDRVHVIAGAARTSGQAVVETNLHGFAETSAAINAGYSLRLTGVFEIDFIASSVVGDVVLINDTTNALTRVAYDAAVSAGTRAFAKVVGVPNATPPINVPVPVTGKMWIKLLDQAGALGASSTA